MLDFVAGGFELAASYTIGNKKRVGFLLNIVGNALWVYLAFSYRLYGLLLVCVPALGLNVRNFVKWQRKPS